MRWSHIALQARGRVCGIWERMMKSGWIGISALAVE